ncbi:MAG: Zn-ribbon domain-containing OB-fold protein [Ignisphaera sp.]|nr:Zn-ribbon domain-containing OB-fold protein [Ignisphaera sp.]MCX8168229.1 Zn-ribbon domain-containing OB-fold protein [Ignisphaera sp.]MDW8084902.1 Zn-ribbon domain-containing OB-fold protein [Ignisphaera sp.]
MKISPARVWREKGSRYRLEGSKCKKCNRVFYPPKPSCPYCSHSETEKIDLPKRGRVISWTVEYVVPEGYREYAPIIIGLIELEDGTKVLAPIVDVDVDKVYEGMHVEAVLRKIFEDGNEGIIIYGIKFSPTI